MSSMDDTSHANIAQEQGPNVDFPQHKQQSAVEAFSPLQQKRPQHPLLRTGGYWFLFLCILLFLIFRENDAQDTDSLIAASGLSLLLAPVFAIFTKWIGEVRGTWG